MEGGLTVTYKIVIPKELLANIYVKLSAWSKQHEGIVALMLRGLGKSQPKLQPKFLARPTL